MNKQGWLKEVHDNIQKGKANLTEKDIRFFHVERLQRIAGHIEGNSSDCAYCLKMKIPVLELSANLNLYIHGSIKDRVYHEEIFDRAVTHLKVSHGIYPSFHFNYLYSFIGFIAGLGFGIAIYFLFIGLIELKLILVLALVGLLAGQIAGRKKDNIVRREGRKL